ncbi:hypothetical protein HNP84_006461 [Thermocatellispora tengchongensis]|uniref:Uncharacterized protein n=1 Tax=Thermocatellispora tengchongensis TaxID=1073253 RepID=A0A840PGS7_9ACTN|nr:hypothetical protein [Thermocatellispora tengchongensis]MBB5136710.1 hypothetical protein [Thermocatellispora tengchongensis]
MAVFLSLTVVLSAPAQTAVITTGERLWALPLMLAPGAAALATRWVLGEAVVQGAFDKATTGGHGWLWVGEQGLLLIAANMALVVIIGVSRWTIRRSPGSHPEVLLRP